MIRMQSAIAMILLSSVARNVGDKAVPNGLLGLKHNLSRVMGDNAKRRGGSPARRLPCASVRHAAVTDVGQRPAKGR